MSWPLIALKDLVDINIGRTPSRDNADYWGSGTPWLSIRDMNQGKILLKTAEQITPQALEDTKIGLATKGTVLFSFKLSIGKVGIAGLDMCHNEAIASMPIKKGVDLCEEYLYFALKQLDSSKDADRAVMGATLNKKKMAELKIPLPPLETQKKIAAVLEKADQLRKDCQQMEQELNSLAQSVFIDMFGDPVTNPKGWDKAPLSKIADDFLGGKSLVAAEDQSTFYKNRVLKISAVTSGEFKPQESKPLPNDYQPQAEHFVKAGDLLFSRANTTELVGATAIVFEEHTGLVLPDKLWRFVWKDEKSLSPVFIWQQLCEAGVRKEISKLSSGSGGSMKNISKGKLNTLQIVFPPLELQQKFERIYLKLRVELSNNQQQIKFADQAFNALMQKVFKSELDL